MTEGNTFKTIEEMREHLARKKALRNEKKASRDAKRKGLFASKTREEMNDRTITPLWEMRTRAGLAIGIVLVPIGILFHACSNMDFEGGSAISEQLCSDRKDDLNQAMIRRQFGQASSGDIQWQTQRMLAACN